MSKVGQDLIKALEEVRASLDCEHIWVKDESIERLVHCELCGIGMFVPKARMH